MATSWMIPTHGDPLKAVRGIVQTLWRAADLNQMLLPLNGSAENSGPEFVRDADQIANLNPFTPLMPVNAAGLVPELLRRGTRTAALLRPCELRTLQAMSAHQHVTAPKLLTVCVDCLGTLPADEFEWRAQRKGSPKGLAQEALQFARQGGIVPYRYRAACQICLSPEAAEADINIGVLGLPVRQALIVTVADAALARQLRAAEALPLAVEISAQRERVIGRLVERAAQTRARISSGLAQVLPANLDALIAQLEACGDCQACLRTCPLCAFDFPARDAQGHYRRPEVERWLVSCSGCGMCEQSCPAHLPLTILFGHIRAQLTEARLPP